MFRVLAFWWLYKRAKPFPSPLVFLKFLCQESCLHSQIGFSKCSRQLLHNHHLNTCSFFFCNSMIHENFISTSFCALYIYIICVCIYFWLINFYLWLVLVFLFNRVSYGFTPLQRCMSRHFLNSCFGLWAMLRLSVAIGMIGKTFFFKDVFHFNTMF